MHDSAKEGKKPFHPKIVQVKKSGFRKLSAKASWLAREFRKQARPGLEKIELMR